MKNIFSKLFKPKNALNRQKENKMKLEHFYGKLAILQLDNSDKKIIIITEADLQNLFLMVQNEYKTVEAVVNKLKNMLREKDDKVEPDLIIIKDDQ